LDGRCLIALTSIHWRESWKYGERAFRYCQHDLGHAIAAIRLAAALVGWRATVLSAWRDDDLRAVTGVFRESDYEDAEAEEPGCVLEITSTGATVPHLDVSALCQNARNGQWNGKASQLSVDHVQWTFIDDIAAATRAIGPGITRRTDEHEEQSMQIKLTASVRERDARAIMRQRRSAVALDGRSALDVTDFFEILARLMPGRAAPWDALWWPAHVHLLLFVQRIKGLDPGLYLLLRRSSKLHFMRTAFGREFGWERVDPALPLFLLAPGDCRRLAERLSCDQAIAGDGFFSLGMLTEFEASIEARGPSFYRQLFWEAGVIGQVLYLEAEAFGARGTGIGCFYDDAVHEVVGVRGHAVQSLYHFTVGVPVEDVRLTVEAGYAWERGQR
jgi:nitroreductase